MVRRQTSRIIIIGFTVTLAALLVLWSYTSLAADINNSLTAGPDPAHPNQTVVLTGRNFESDELVGIWVTYPNFKVYPVAEIRADGDGNFTLTYLPNFVGEPSGQYVYTALGHSTQRQVYAYLQVETSLVAPAPSGGFTGLSVSPNAAEQLGTVTLLGQGYKGNEKVSVWVTYPDFSVDKIDVVKADGDGNFSITYTPQFRGDGEYIFTAQGNSSSRTFYAELQLGPLLLPTAVPEPTSTPAPVPPADGTRLGINPATVAQRQPVTLTGTGFSGNAKVSIWVTFPQESRVETIDQITTDSNGNFSLTITPSFFDDPAAPTGQYIYTALDTFSGRQVYASLQYGAPQPLPALPGTGVDEADLTTNAVSDVTANSTNLAETALIASPALARQNDTVTIEGRGFTPNEMVAIWITYPNFEVYSVAEIATDGDGNFTYPYVLDFLSSTFTPTGKYTYTAHGKTSGREVYADIQVEVPPAPATSSAIDITIEPGWDGQGSFFTIRGANYGTEEPLALWLRYPDNTVQDLGQIEAGPTGIFEYTLWTAGVPTGRYAFTAYGLRTGLNGIAEFDVVVSDLTFAAGSANLHIRPTGDDQRSYAIFEGSGFQPGEPVSIWVTLPDNSTLAIGDVQASENGAFVASLYLGEQEPVGLRTYTAYGNFSGLRAIADYTLVAGGSETFQTLGIDTELRP